MSAPRRKTVCLDFDGVIHLYSSGWKGADVVADGPVPGAMAALFAYSKLFDVCVLSSRSHETGGRDTMMYAIMGWASKEGFSVIKEMDALRFVEPGCTPISFPLHKPPAFVTIDDRAITFDGTWPTVETIAAFKPWNMDGSRAGAVSAAVNTLIGLGYTWNGGVQWKPPLGRAPAFVTGSDPLIAEVNELPNPQTSLMSHNERELIGLCKRLAEALAAPKAE